LLNGWGFNYCTSRAFITACIAFSLQLEVNVIGRLISHKTIQDLEEGSVLIADYFEGGFPKDSHGHWNPDDLLTSQSMYLKDIRPEPNNYHIESALGLYKEFYDKGYLENKYFSIDVDKFLLLK